MRLKRERPTNLYRIDYPVRFFQRAIDMTRGTVSNQFGIPRDSARPCTTKIRRGRLRKIPFSVQVGITGSLQKNQPTDKDGLVCPLLQRRQSLPVCHRISSQWKYAAATMRRDFIRAALWIVRNGAG